MTGPDRRIPTSATARRLRALGSLRGTPPPIATDPPDDPVTLFLDWLDEAVHAGVPEPHAATLATVDADGIPDARTLLLKDVGDAGWAVAGPRSSRKAAQLAARPAAALSFWWQPVVRAVRVRGTVREGTRDEIAADLAARPVTTADAAADWMLWWIRPLRVEFWQGAASRDHTRLVYEAVESGWTHGVVGGQRPTEQEGITA